MKAYAAFAPGDIRAVELPLPEPDEYEVLVKNEGCIFCNTTDRMIVDNLFATKAYPVVFGHESFGHVVKVGAKVKKYKMGDRVICTNAIVSGFDGTYYSSWGGFAEYGIAGDLDAYLSDGGVLDEKNQYRRRYSANLVIDKTLPIEKAGLVFPLSETAGALLTLGDLHGKNVAVIGTGIAGYSLTCFAHRYGAAVTATLGRRESRLETARKLGADKTFTDVRQADAFFRSVGGADIIIEASGNANALEQGLPYLKEGGTLATYAVPHGPYAFGLLNCPHNFRYQRIDPRVEDAVELVTEMLRKDEIPTELLLTHIWPLEKLPEAFEQVRRGEVVKGLIRME